MLGKVKHNTTWKLPFPPLYFNQRDNHYWLELSTQARSEGRDFYYALSVWVRVKYHKRIKSPLGTTSTVQQILH